MSKETAGHGGRPMEEQTTATMGTSRTPIETSKLTDFLPAMGPKWFEIALKLGCKDTAKELRYSNEPALRLCFVVIDEWMDKGGENACWEYLCKEVLRSEGVGLGQLADRIERVIAITASIGIRLKPQMYKVLDLSCSSPLPQELGLDSTRKASPQPGGSTGRLIPLCASSCL